MIKRQTVKQIISGYSCFVIVTIVLALPLTYLLISWQHLDGTIGTEAEITARIISQVISSNPDLWEYEDVRIQEYLSRRPEQGVPEMRRIVNGWNKTVAEVADETPWPVLMRAAVLYDAGSPVGRIEISGSMRPYLRNALFLMVAMTPLGVGTFYLLRKIPLDAIQRSEASLRWERDTAQRYLDVAGVIFLALDAAGRATLINRKGCSILERFETDVLGKDWFTTFVPQSDRAEDRAFYERLTAGGPGQLTTYEGAVVTSSGQHRMIAWHIIVLGDEQNAFTGSLWSGEDITHRRKLESQLRHAQKLEAIGQLAAGVAHDFNNILAAITGYASMLQMAMPEDDPQRHNVEQVLAAAERAAYVTKSLLAFSRKQIMNPKPVDVNWIVERAERLLHRLIGENIAMRTRLLPEGVRIFADAVQIEQVLMNLVTNSRDAMPEGGNLLIETDQVVADDEFVREHGLRRNGVFALITVSDTGSGMDDATLDKIFEPFFTTKEVGKGTGLGLANVYGIVKQHNGTVEVASELGRGATFRIYLPAIQTVADDMRSAETIPPPGGAETVLVAEDDEAVRAMTVSILQNFGYTVLACGDGDEAVRLFAAHRDEISLALLDVIMPKMTGKDAYEEMAALKPGLRVLYTSGHTFDVMHEKGLLDTRRPFLAKPASPAELLKKVREVLDR